MQTRTGKNGLGVAPRGGFDISIPRLVRSRLELTLPANAPAIEVPSAKGSVAIEGRELSGELGATDRLCIRWPEDAARRGAEPVVEAEELLWLKIAPGSVVLDARVTFRVLQGQATEFTFIADPRLRLFETVLDRHDRVRSRLALSSTRQAFATVRRSGDRRGRFFYSKRVRAWATSAYRNFTSRTFGQPDVGLPSPWTKTCVMKPRPPSRLPPWPCPLSWRLGGTTDSPPAFAHGLAERPALWTISTRPWRPRTTVDQKLRVSFGDRNLEIGFEADLTTRAGYGFRYRIEAPATLEVDKVAVLEEDIDRVARWVSRAGRGDQRFPDRPGHRCPPTRGASPPPHAATRKRRLADPSY